MSHFKINIHCLRACLFTPTAHVNTLNSTSNNNDYCTGIIFLFQKNLRWELNFTRWPEQNLKFRNSFKTSSVISASQLYFFEQNKRLGCELCKVSKTITHFLKVFLLSKTRKLSKVTTSSMSSKQSL